jgi:anti-sigma-K factor RskA
MEQQGIHGLTAAYALDALDERDELEYEEHLRSCERCRDELAALTETASSLAYAVETPAPPAALRGRILEQARSERNVIPLRPRRLPYALGAVAAMAATVALALGIWGASVAGDRDELRQALQARVIPLPDGTGRLHVEPDGDATLVVDRAEAPPGKDYELWVFEGATPRPAGVFDGGREVVRLTRPVPRGASVAMTLERDGGVDAPTTEPLFVVRG